MAAFEVIVEKHAECYAVTLPVVGVVAAVDGAVRQVAAVGADAPPGIAVAVAAAVADVAVAKAYKRAQVAAAAAEGDGLGGDAVADAG